MSLNAHNGMTVMYVQDVWKMDIKLLLCVNPKASFSVRWSFLCLFVAGHIRLVVRVECFCSDIKFNILRRWSFQQILLKLWNGYLKIVHISMLVAACIIHMDLVSQCKKHELRVNVTRNMLKYSHQVIVRFIHGPP